MAHTSAERKTTMSKLRFFMLAVALALVAIASSTTARASQCVCTHLYYPVQCSDGNVYGNPCLANCAGATDCVPVEDW
jgi:hypothetical protein